LAQKLGKIIRRKSGKGLDRCKHERVKHWEKAEKGEEIPGRTQEVDILHQDPRETKRNIVIIEREERELFVGGIKALGKKKGKAPEEKTQLF